MRKVTFLLLIAFVFSLPWEQVVAVGPFGSASRALGGVAVVTGLLAVVAGRRVRRLSLPLWLALAFSVANVLSLFWTIDINASFERVSTYGQLLCIAWLVWEFTRTPQEHDVLFAAFWMGACVAIVSQFRNVASGIQAVAGAGPTEARYAATNADPNDFGFMLGLTLPMAWYLFVSGGRLTRIAAVAYVPVAVSAILLTASRGAFLGGLVALSVVPFTQRRSPRSWAILAGMIAVAIGAALVVVPPAAWARVLTARTELQGGTMSGRTLIWTAGLDAFYRHPVIGVGAGAFSVAVEWMVGGKAAHNAPLAILVEQGVVGFSIFVALLAACARQIARLPPPLRAVWTAIGVTWLLGSMTLSWQHTKVTWFLVALLAARHAVEAESISALARERRHRRRSSAAPWAGRASARLIPEWPRGSAAPQGNRL